MQRRVILILVAVACVASCSGSSKSAAPPTTGTTTTTAQLTKASYLTAGNAICRTLNERINALGQPSNDMQKAADLNDEAERVTAGALQKLRELPVPPGEASAVAAVYAKVDVFLADAAPLSGALRSGDTLAASKAQSRLENDLQAANAAATDYGLTVCGA